MSASLMLTYVWSGTEEHLTGVYGQCGPHRLGTLAIRVLQERNPSEDAVAELRSMPSRYEVPRTVEFDNWLRNVTEADSPGWRGIPEWNKWTSSLFASLLCCYDVWREVHRFDDFRAVNPKADEFLQEFMVHPEQPFFEPLIDVIWQDGNSRGLMTLLQGSLFRHWKVRSTEPKPDDDFFVKIVHVTEGHLHRQNEMDAVRNLLVWDGADRKGVTWRVADHCSHLEGIIALVWLSALLGLNLDTLRFCSVCSRLFLVERHQGKRRVCPPPSECQSVLSRARKKIKDRLDARVRRGWLDKEELAEKWPKLEALYEKIPKGEATLSDYQEECERLFPFGPSRWHGS